jgi:hypothetical protein
VGLVSPSGFSLKIAVGGPEDFSRPRATTISRFGWSPDFRSSYSRAFPSVWYGGRPRFRPDYSGGAAPDSHRIPVHRNANLFDWALLYLKRGQCPARPSRFA